MFAAVSVEPRTAHGQWHTPHTQTWRGTGAVSKKVVRVLFPFLAKGNVQNCRASRERPPVCDLGKKCPFSALGEINCGDSGTYGWLRSTMTCGECVPGDHLERQVLQMYQRPRRLKSATLIGSLLALSPGLLLAQGQTDAANQQTTPRQRDPNRREWYRDEQGHPTRRYPKQLDLRPQFYRDGYGYRFGVPTFDQIRDEDLERAYQRGLEDGRAWERKEIQAERGFGAFEQAMSTGQTAFETGQYGLAARHFLLAATLNQGDPASRLAAAHAQAALGEYEPAARLVRRAFELQPRLVYLPMDIRGSYGTRADFDRHLNVLSKAADKEEANGPLRFLLGYYCYYSDQMERAAIEFEKAADLDPRDPLLPQLTHLSKLTAPGQLRGSHHHDAPDHQEHP